MELVEDRVGRAEAVALLADGLLLGHGGDPERGVPLGIAAPFVLVDNPSRSDSD